MQRKRSYARAFSKAIGYGKLAYNTYKRFRPAIKAATKTAKGIKRHLKKPKRTHKKREEPRQISRGASIPGTISKFTERHKKPRGYGRLITKMSQPQYYQKVGGGNINAAYNKQGLQDLLAVFDYTDLSTIYAACGGVSSDTASAATQRVFMEHCQQTWYMTNQTNTVVHIDLYDLRSKKVTDLLASGYRMPFTDYATKGLQQEQGTAVTNPLDNLGCTPGMSKWFNKKFQIMKKVHIILGPGQTHEHRSFQQVNRQFDASILRGLATGDGIPGWTRWISTISYGSATNDSTTKTNFGTSLVDVDLVYTLKYRYRYLELDTTTYTRSNALGAVTHAAVADIMSGLITTEQTAGPQTV